MGSAALDPRRIVQQLKILFTKLKQLFYGVFLFIYWEVIFKYVKKDPVAVGVRLAPRHIIVCLEADAAETNSPPRYFTGYPHTYRLPPSESDANRRRAAALDCYG